MDFRNEDGQTALQIAAKRGHKEVVEKLLSLDVVDHTKSSIIDRVNTIFDYVNDDEHFDVKCFGEGPMFYMKRSKGDGMKTLLQSIVDQKLVKEREQVLDIITKITMAKLGIRWIGEDCEEDVKSLVLEEVKKAVPSSEGLADALVSVGERFPWAIGKMIGMFSISLIIMFVAWAFYIADVVTDVYFCLDKFRMAVSNFTRIRENCIQEIPIPNSTDLKEDHFESIYHCKKNFSYHDCEDTVKYLSKVGDCYLLGDRFQDYPDEWLNVGLVSSVHCVLPILYSIVIWIILEIHHLQLKSFLRLPLPLVAWIYKTYCDWKLYNFLIMKDTSEHTDRRRKEGQKKWKEESEKHDNIVNLASVIEAGTESSFQFFFQG